MDAVGIVLYEKIRLETGAGMKVQKDSGRRKKIAIILLIFGTLLSILVAIICYRIIGKYYEKKSKKSNK